MGMFDIFETNREFVCSHCGHSYKISDGIQSKNFESELNYFISGDVVRDLDDRKFVEDYIWCPKCSEEIKVYFSFYNTIYIETFQTPEDAEKSSEEFNIIDSYKKLNRERNSFRDKFNSLKSDIEAVYDVHSVVPTKSRFMPLVMLRLDGILDYNIVKTIKNIIDKY